MKQQEHFQNYDDAKDELMDEMRENEGATMIEEMLKERRDWVTEYRRKNLGKIPDDLKEFHERNNVAVAYKHVLAYSERCCFLRHLFSSSSIGGANSSSTISGKPNCSSISNA